MLRTNGLFQGVGPSCQHACPVRCFNPMALSFFCRVCIFLCYDYIFHSSLPLALYIRYCAGKCGTCDINIPLRFLSSASTFSPIGCIKPIENTYHSIYTLQTRYMQAYSTIIFRTFQVLKIRHSRSFFR